MDPADVDRFNQMAEDYDQVAPLLVPMYDFLQDEMIRHAGIATQPHPRVVDLGAGSGRLLEKVLLASPDAVCFWIDSSEPFQQVARRRLERFADRVTYILSRIEDDWPSRLGAPVDAIFSMSAIHHLESYEKRAVYAAAFEALRPGGWFINTDEMKALTDSAYRASLNFWARHVDEQFSRVPAPLVPHAKRFEQHFANWKRRNIDGIDRPKSKGDDLHEPFVDQARWLTDIGFEEVDVLVKYHLWACLGGRKPAVAVGGS